MDALDKVLPQLCTNSSNSSFLFTVTKRKHKEREKCSTDRQPLNYYISAVNAKLNPDLLLGGGSFLKGNLYFKKDVIESSPEESVSADEMVLKTLSGESEEVTDSTNTILFPTKVSKPKRGIIPAEELTEDDDDDDDMDAGSDY